MTLREPSEPGARAHLAGRGHKDAFGVAFSALLADTLTSYQVIMSKDGLIPG